MDFFNTINEKIDDIYTYSENIKFDDSYAALHSGEESNNNTNLNAFYK